MFVFLLLFVGQTECLDELLFFGARQVGQMFDAFAQRDVLIGKLGDRLFIGVQVDFVAVERVVRVELIRREVETKCAVQTAQTYVAAVLDRT